MLTKTLVLFLMALSLCSAASAKVHRGRPRKNKIFAANHNSVALENAVADAMGASRYNTQAEVDADVRTRKLVPIRTWTSPKLPSNRSYALPATVDFVYQLNLLFFRQFGHSLMVDSAVRPATLQIRLLRWNRSAAPAYGERASTHERGTTVDISKNLTRAEHEWLIWKLLYFRETGHVLVIEERACFHIFVKGELNGFE